MATTAQLFKIPDEEVQTLVLRFPKPWREDPDWFFNFCRANDELRIERTAEGEILVMAPAGFEGGYLESRAFAQLDAWAERDGTGRAFNSNTGYVLPNKANRSPDASWVKMSRIAKLAAAQKRSSRRSAPISSLRFVRSRIVCRNCKRRWRNTAPTAQISAG